MRSQHASKQTALNFEVTDVPIKLPFADYAYPVSRDDWNGVVLVGEAPGAEEAKLGQPFVGRSGKLLNEALLAAGINRAHCLIANIFRFQPPGNKIDFFFRSKRAALAEHHSLDETLGQFAGKYVLAQYASELAHLGSMLADWQPRAIIALGRTPLWGLTGQEGLLSLVGKPLPCRLYGGVKVMPTYHPSFILRGNWKLQDQWISHLAQAVA